MNKTLLNPGIFTAVFLMFCHPLIAQQPGEKNENVSIRSFHEELFLQTDRDFYISGEEVWFKVYKLNGINHAPSDVSKVVYIELLDKNNFPVKQIKLQCNGTSGSSGFIIPDNQSTGNYVIRAYTSWMKNYPADLFFYKEISVINPFEKISNLGLPPEGQSSKAVTSGLNTPGEAISKEMIKFIISPDKPEYSKREQIKIGIRAVDMTGNPVKADLSVSVVKSGILNPAGITGSASYTSLITSLSGTFATDIDTPRYLPEMEEHMITGFVRMKSTDEPLRRTDLSLSFVGKSARNQFGRTDNNGQFYFLVKESGLNEIVIQPLSPELTGYYIELVQPFSNSFTDFRSMPLNIDSSKIRAIDNAVVSMQVYNIYMPFRKKNKTGQKPVQHDFFGKPENTIRMADYIELTSLREVVKEIIPNVYTLKQSGKYDFKLINKYRGQPFENKPLVLVDGVPVYDFEKVLNINSKEIEKADVINTRYFFSENIFDGILNFTTKKGDLSALQFDNSVFRQVYEGCQVIPDFYSPEYSTDSLRNSRIPDFRNTLYWNPEAGTSKDGRTETGFYSSDESAEYTIIVEGITPEGKRGYSTATFIVK